MPSPSRNEAGLRRAKEAKQKKLLLALAPILVILLVVQGPRVLDALSGGETLSTDETALQTPSPGEPLLDGSGSLDPATAPSPSTSGVGNAAPEPQAVSLPDTNVLPDPAEGQLTSLDRFVGKDPFDQQVEDASPEDAVAGQPPPDGGGEGGDDQGVGVPTAAVVRVNGRLETVSVGGSFPSGDEVFRLVAVDEVGVKIGLVDGAYTTGGETIELELGEGVTLVSQPDGVRYRVELERVK